MLTSAYTVTALRVLEPRFPSGRRLMSVKEGFDLNRYQFIIHSTQLELLDLGQEPHYKHYRAEYFKQVLGIKKKVGGDGAQITQTLSGRRSTGLCLYSGRRCRNAAFMRYNLISI